MPKLTIKDLERRMKPIEVKIAYLVTENEFLPKDQRRTMQEIAKEVGIARQNLYNHLKKDDVIRLMALIGDQHLDAFKTRVDKALMRLIDDGSDRLPSIKAIELFYKMKGYMEDKRTITLNDERDVQRLTQEEIDEELDKLNDLLQ